MDVVNPAAGSLRKTPGLFDMMAEHTEHFVAKTEVLQIRAATFGAEREMKPDLREGLRHGKLRRTVGPLGLVC